MGAAQRVQGDEKDHRVRDAEQRRCDDGNDRPDAAEDPGEEVRRADAEKQGEGTGPERSLCEDIKRQAPYECPYEPGFESHRDRDDDSDDKDEMRLRSSDPEVRPDGEFDKGDDGRTEGGE